MVVMATTARTLIDQKRNVARSIRTGVCHVCVCSLVFVGERTVGGGLRCDRPYTCNPSTWTREAGGLGQGQLHPHSKFEVLLGHIRPRLKGSGCEKAKKISWDRLI